MESTIKQNKSPAIARKRGFPIHLGENLSEKGEKHKQCNNHLLSLQTNKNKYPKQ
ncbi:MAG: hypothetical protein Q4A50_06270 [Bacteroidales bacterium]|nr:hypothetical protein [Bacteroidales bacterium]